VENGADPNAPDVNGNTPMHMAAAVGNERLLQVRMIHSYLVDGDDGFPSSPTATPGRRMTCCWSRGC
jgi:ankyrin repeat protein